MRTKWPQRGSMIPVSCAFPVARHTVVALLPIDTPLDTPLWKFHGGSDQTVPVSVSRDRIAARRKAGGHPLYTEYAGVDHNVWQWVFTEPGLENWLFAKRRG